MYTILKGIGLIGLFCMLFSMTHCANSSVSPTGGAKDTIPPSLIGLYPAQRSTRFSGKELVFTFDEYVRLKDQQKQFIISPAPEKKPIIKLRKKSVVVEFQEPLKDSTTYYVDFGISIVDLNEDNPGENLNFTFSTGPKIDTLVYAGQVVDAYSLDPVEGAFCFLYEKNYDSIPFLEKPSALARTDKDGAFLVKGLKDQYYKIVAVVDVNANLKYNPGAEKIAFQKHTIQPQRLTEHDSIAFADLPILNLFSEPSNRQALIENKRLEARQVQLVFSSYYPKIDSLVFHGIDDKDLLKVNNFRGDTINIWLLSKVVSDTLTARIVYHKTDTTNQLTPFGQTLKLNFEKPKKKASERNKDEDAELVLTPKIDNSYTQIAINQLPISVKAPLTNISDTRIQLFEFDDERKNKTIIPSKLVPVKQSVFNYQLEAKWKTSAQYELLLLPGALLDCYGAMNDTIISKIETQNPDKFGILNLKFHAVKQQYIVQVLSGKNIVQSALTSADGTIQFSYLAAGKYTIKLIEDLNANGVWDPGDYLKGLLPEKVLIVVFADSEAELAMRPNWTVDQDIYIDKLFTNEEKDVVKKAEEVEEL